MTNKYYDRKENEADKVAVKKMLKDEYKEDWCMCDKINAPLNSIEEFLGEIDADIEWNKDSKSACERFINIDAYTRFKSSDYIILVGRTGTGKSSILNRYKYAVERQEIEEFLFVVSIRFQKLFDKLITYDFEEYRDTNYQIQYVIELVIRLFLILKILETTEENDDIKIIRNAINGLDIEAEDDIIKQIYSDLDDYSVESGNDIILLKNAVKQLKRVYREVMTNTVDHAIERILGNEKVVVLVDSLDYYDIQEKKAIHINKVLVEMAFEYLQLFHKSHIMLKIALPSEVYTYILEQILAKEKGKIVTIEWSYKEIVKMLAIKIFSYFNKENHQFASEYINQYKLNDLYNYDVAYEFLHTILPKQCSTCIPLMFETLPHCIRHTQKKPRQIIQVFNAIIQKIVSEKNFKYFIDNESTVRNYIHIAQCGIIEDSLSMYNQIAQNSVLDVVYTILHNKRNFLSYHEFVSAVKSATSMFTKIGLAMDDVIQILIESGLIGQVKIENYIPANNNYFKNANVCKISIVVFEYQQKERLPRNSNDTIYVLHPMCYEYYENIIDRNALVYPAPINDKNDNIITLLEEGNCIY